MVFYLASIVGSTFYLVVTAQADKYEHVGKNCLNLVHIQPGMGYGLRHPVQQDLGTRPTCSK